MRSFGNFAVAPVLGSSCTTFTLRSCAPYAPINSSKYLCSERSLVYQSGNQRPVSLFPANSPLSRVFSYNHAEIISLRHYLLPPFASPPRSPYPLLFLSHILPS
ncbi:MAG: hypothetical protein LBJ16_03025 [Holosporaceae bacterium]|nr:hypothetical protein [Holosporaceae bacterium]